MGLLDAATGAEALPSTLLELKEAEQTFALTGVAQGTTAVLPSVLRGFSAPVRLQYEPPLEDKELAFLMQVHKEETYVFFFNFSYLVNGRLMYFDYAGMCIQCSTRVVHVPRFNNNVNTALLFSRANIRLHLNPSTPFLFPPNRMLTHSLTCITPM